MKQHILLVLIHLFLSIYPLCTRKHCPLHLNTHSITTSDVLLKTTVKRKHRHNNSQRIDPINNTSDSKHFTNSLHKNDNRPDENMLAGKFY